MKTDGYTHVAAFWDGQSPQVTRLVHTLSTHQHLTATQSPQAMLTRAHTGLTRAHTGLITSQ